MTASKKQNTRKPAVAPEHVYEGMTLLDYLSNCQPPIDNKIIEIVCAKTKIPANLRQETAQEIRISWSQNQPDFSTYEPSQVASYAEVIARNTALKSKRELGSAVRLPGSAFRKRRDGSSYVTAGVLASALDWNELESWMNTDQTGSVDGVTQPHGGFEDIISKMESEGDLVGADEEQQARQARSDHLIGVCDMITEQQRNIIQSLIDGATLEEIMVEFGLKRGVLMREISIAGTFLGPEFREGDYGSF